MDPAVTAAQPTHLLSVLIWLPAIAGIFVMFLPRQTPWLLRAFGIGTGLFVFGKSLQLLTGSDYARGMRFVENVEWIPSLGIRYHLGVDGLSIWLLILTTFLTPLVMYVSFGSIKTRQKEYIAAFLLLESAMIGAFVSLDMFLFYVFWELMLVPMYVMIGIWGGAEKIKASIKFFIYTMAGSMLLLAAMVYLVWTHQKLTGVWSFDLLALSQVVLPARAQLLCFWAFSIAFFIKVPMWPVHTWLPDAHVQAPTGGSVILAAVMLKIGTYAYMRFSMGLFPAQAASFAANLAGVAILGGIIYGALVAWKQQDVKRLVAYSSVAHLGYVMLGLFGATPTGMQGAVLQMVNHGLSTGALFLLVGVIYDRRHTREVEEFGGLAKVMPVYTALFIVVTFSSIGVPGTNGFIGEFMIVTATYSSEVLGRAGGLQTVGAAFGVILAAVYMLSVVQKMFFGPLTNPKNKHLSDISGREVVALAPLVAMIFVIGLFPNVFLDRMRDAVVMHHNQFISVASKLSGANGLTDERKASLLPEGSLAPSYLQGAPLKSQLNPPPAPAGGHAQQE